VKAKGQDVKIMLMRDGAELVSFRTQNAITINFGLATTIHNPVGSTAPEIYGQNDEVVVSLTPEPDRPEFLELLDAQRKANLPNASRTAVAIDMTCSVDFGSEGRARVGLQGGVVRSASLTTGGRTDRVTAPIEIVFPTWKRI